jgi:hypothetical protein
MIQRPRGLGLTLCDQVVFEQGTQKPTLVGVFTGIAVDGFPSDAQRFDAFAALTDGLGDSTIDLIAIHLDTDRQVYAQSAEFRFVDPLTVVNLRFRVRQCSFPSAGAYVFALVVDGEEVAQRRIQVYLTEESQ